MSVTDKIKVISLWQPWASLVALGEKTIETRSWKTNYRGPLAIHATASMPKLAKELCLTAHFKTALWRNLIITPLELPLGKIIATCNLTECYEILPDTHNYAFYGTSQMGIALHKNSSEYAFGDYTPGRYAWILKDIEMLSEPILAKGQQGFWNFDI